MNLKQSLDLAGLGTVKSENALTRLSAKKVSKRVFTLAEQEGRPFEQITASQWREKWLASSEFVLMDVPTTAVAAPLPARNMNKVLANVQASSSSLEPIIVDVNKRQVGRLPSGYVPSVIVVDGKHRHEARTIQGMGTIRAWVGIKALKFFRKSQPVTTVTEQTGVKVSKLEAAAIISVPRQDRAINGDRPHAHIPSAFPTNGNGNLDTPLQPITKNVRRGGSQTGLGVKKINKTGVLDAGGAGGAGSAGAGGAAAGGGPAGSSLGSGGSSNPSRIGVFAQDLDPSDVTQDTAPDLVDPTDVAQTFRDKESPSYQAPGAGVGPRTKPSVGGKNSELKKREVKADSKMNAKGKFVKKIVTKDKKKKKVEAVAPPGREKQVLKLKKEFGKKSATPFKIAWSQYNDKH